VRSRTSRPCALDRVSGRSSPRSLGSLTAAVGNVCHLATGHDVALCIFDNLGRRERRGLGCDGGIHADHGCLNGNCGLGHMAQRVAGESAASRKQHGEQEAAMLTPGIDGSMRL